MPDGTAARWAPGSTTQHGSRLLLDAAHGCGKPGVAWDHPVPGDAQGVLPPWGGEDGEPSGWGEATPIAPLARASHHPITMTTGWLREKSPPPQHMFPPQHRSRQPQWGRDAGAAVGGRRQCSPAPMGAGGITRAWQPAALHLPISFFYLKWIFSPCFPQNGGLEASYPPWGWFWGPQCCWWLAMVFPSQKRGASQRYPEHLKGGCSCLGPPPCPDQHTAAFVPSSPPPRPWHPAVPGTRAPAKQTLSTPAPPKMMVLWVPNPPSHSSVMPKGVLVSVPAPQLPPGRWARG